MVRRRKYGEWGDATLDGGNGRRCKPYFTEACSKCRKHGRVAVAKHAHSIFNIPLHKHRTVRNSISPIAHNALTNLLYVCAHVSARIMRIYARA
jgi:hypothetical protein